MVRVLEPKNNEYFFHVNRPTGSPLKMELPNLYFDVPHLYYLPQFLPIYHELKKRGIEPHFLFYKDIDGEELLKILRNVASDENLSVDWVNNLEEGLAFYKQKTPDWIIFGNAYKFFDQLPSQIKTAMVNHGAGIKSAGHDISMLRFNIRFAEGPYQLAQLQKNYPQGNFIDVGFSKLDPIFNPQIPTPTLDKKALRLDEGKPTLLYAPTFYPSSIELFPDDWPQQFNEFNLVVKPHFFTYTKEKYKAQRRKLTLWEKSANVYVASVDEYNLLPFFSTADLLISDASTALFEFAALNKPVIWCDFLKLRWSYRGIFAYRFRRRMDQDIQKYADIALHVSNYRNLLSSVKQQLTSPSEYEPKRLEYSEQLLGRLDGQVSVRIVNNILEYKG